MQIHKDKQSEKLTDGSNVGKNKQTAWSFSDNRVEAQRIADLKQLANNSYGATQLKVINQVAGYAALKGKLRGTKFFQAISAPVAENGADFYAHDDVDYPALGFTTKLEDTEGPDIEYGITDMDDGRKKAKPTITSESDEGTNSSWALAEGTHLVDGEQENDKQLYLILSAEIAAKVLQAEEEHVSDYRYAREQILDKADDWMNDNVGEREFIADTEDNVSQEVDNYLNAGLKAHLGLVNVEDFEWVNIDSYYKRAANLTDTRDEKGWHTLGEADEELGDRVNRTITTGTSEIGNHSSADLIDLTKLI